MLSGPVLIRVRARFFVVIRVNGDEIQAGAREVSSILMHHLQGAFCGACVGEIAYRLSV